MRFGQLQQQRRHLRTIAPGAASPAGQAAAHAAVRTVAQLRPFIERFAPLAVPDAHAAPPLAPRPSLTPEQLSDLAAAIGQCGLALRRAGVKGWPYHRRLQGAIAELAADFHAIGFLECPAAYDDPAGSPIAGRMDVVWAASDRQPIALFEIDSTVKRASLEKLHRAAAPHKFWIYFGPDRWAFKTFCRQRGAVIPIVIPRAFPPH